MKDLEIILKNIKKKELLPVYFLHGEEPYYIDAAVKSFENDLLQEDEKAFGQTVLYGRDTSLHEVLSLAKQIPMFGDISLIIIKEAQDLNFKSDAEGKALLDYLENPVGSTVLVFAHKFKKLIGTSRLAKALAKHQFLFESSAVKDYQIAQWIENQCAKLKMMTAPDIAGLLAEYLGNDLSRIDNELNKLKIILKDDQILDAKMVETHVGISKEFNVFELQKALAEKNAEAAFRIAHFMGKNPKNNPFVLTVGRLYEFFSGLILYHTMQDRSPQALAAELKINPYFLKDFANSARLYPLKQATRIISVLREIDLKNKGLGTNQTEESDLLKEMVYKIVNIDRYKVKI